MVQYIPFFEQSIFLSEHASIKKFVQDYLNAYDLTSPQKWSIICERREDIVTIRNQIFIEVERFSLKKPLILNGISIYHLDTLAQKICAILNHIDDKTIRKQIPSSLFKPYIDITAQEKIVEIILNLFGYNNKDSAAISKQILTLIDAPIPEDTNILEILLESQEQKINKKNFYIAEISLRQILATIQQSKIELSQYARFQALVAEYFNIFFKDHIKTDSVKKYFSLPYEIFSSPILWIGAPEYLEHESENNNLPIEKLVEQNKTFKPGNFQKYLVDDFKEVIKNISDDLRIQKPTFYDSKTILTFSSDTKLNNKINIYLSYNDHAFYKSTKDLINKKEKDEFVILGDFNPNNLQFVNINGSGEYSITKKDIEQWKNSSTHDDNYFSKVSEQIDEKYNKFLETLSYIQNIESLKKISESYSLKNIEINEKNSYDLFLLNVLKDKIIFEDNHLLNTAPKVLSFFKGLSLPQKITCVGKPHNLISQSLNIKILNQVFILLKQKGVDIDIPASETMYRLFWKNLMNEIREVDFWIPEKKELNQFPRSFKITNIYSLNSPIEKNFSCYFNKSEEITLPNWKENFCEKMNAIPITQFEDYVVCPHKFFLSHILGIKKESLNNTLDFKEIGNKMHQICEQLITRLVNIFGNDGYVSELPIILNAVVTSLKNEILFLNFDKNFWKQEIKATLAFLNITHKADLMIAFEESINSIWDVSNNNSDFFLIAQQREILKRTFLRFLITESDKLKEKSKLRVGLYREFPISFEMGELKFTGRIDRIDLTPEGIEIIDYKTSNISKSQQKIVFSPSLARESNKFKLSVQGALYTYGFAKLNLVDNIEEAGDDALLNKIKSFSLYFLKNIEEDKNNCMQFNFDSALQKTSFEYLTLENEYTPYVKSLSQGIFSVNPIQGDSTCLYCVHKPICPKSYR